MKQLVFLNEKSMKRTRRLWNY